MPAERLQKILAAVGFGISGRAQVGALGRVSPLDDGTQVSALSHTDAVAMRTRANTQLTLSLEFARVQITGLAAVNTDSTLRGAA